jgi:hypothetical protein
MKISTKKKLMKYKMKYKMKNKKNIIVMIMYHKVLKVH